MPKLASTLLCSGCSACYSICPKSAITMKPDSEGFMRPVIDAALCVECGACEKACHVVSPYEERMPIEVFAARARNNDIRHTSSSGGIFPLLAREHIRNGGLVWGVKWAKDGRLFRAEHDYTSTYEGLSQFRGSKYVQSDIRDTYRNVKNQLMAGERVLFSGTPCQIAGLKHFLRKDYPNLICCDVICHGVPSPKIFHDYIASMLPADTNGHEYLIKDVRFRDKLYENGGWRNGVVVVVVVDKYNGKETEIVVSGKRADTDPYLRGFLNELINRPSCQNCTVRNLKSHADITLGDFWKIQKYAPQIDDNMGVSLVCINSDKGMNALRSVADEMSDCIAFDWVAAVDSTGALVSSPKAHRHRSKFFNTYYRKGFQASIVNKLLRPTVKEHYRNFIKILKAKIRPYIKK